MEIGGRVSVALSALIFSVERAQVACCALWRPVALNTILRTNAISMGCPRGKSGRSGRLIKPKKDTTLWLTEHAPTTEAENDTEFRELIDPATNRKNNEQDRKSC